MIDIQLHGQKFIFRPSDMKLVTMESGSIKILSFHYYIYVTSFIIQVFSVKAYI